jgi:hypothetical protein
MISLTEEQQRALVEEKDKPLVVVNPTTNERFRLVPAVVYDRLQSLFVDHDERFAEDMAPLLWEVMQGDWNDPRLDEYARLVAGAK